MRNGTSELPGYFSNSRKVRMLNQGDEVYHVSSQVVGQRIWLVKQHGHYDNLLLGDKLDQ